MKYKELIKILIEAPRPIKNPSALDVPIANLAGRLFLIKNGTNKVAPPIPTRPEIIEKKNPVKLEIKLFLIVEFLLKIALWVKIL